MAGRLLRREKGTEMPPNMSGLGQVGSLFPSLTGTLGRERKFCGNGKELGASGKRI